MRKPLTDKQKLARKEYVRQYVEDHREHHNAKGREWWRAHPEKLKDNYLKRNYGITLQEYVEKFNAQKRLCAICEEELILGKAMCLDHDHQTRKIRAFLCHHCNMGMGLFEDNPELMQDAVNYLYKYKDKDEETKNK